MFLSFIFFVCQSDLIVMLLFLFDLFSLFSRYIAVEFASIWNGMGVAVDLFFRKELPLRLYRLFLITCFGHI